MVRRQTTQKKSFVSKGKEKANDYQQRTYIITLGAVTMWKTEIPLSDTLRMIDLIKEINIDKYSQPEYREIVNSLMISFITDYEDHEVQEAAICFS